MHHSPTKPKNKQVKEFGRVLRKEVRSSRQSKNHRASKNFRSTFRDVSPDNLVPTNENESFRLSKNPLELVGGDSKQLVYFGNRKNSMPEKLMTLPSDELINSSNGSILRDKIKKIGSNKVPLIDMERLGRGSNQTNQLRAKNRKLFDKHINISSGRGRNLNSIGPYESDTQRFKVFYDSGRTHQSMKKKKLVKKGKKKLKKISQNKD